MSGIHGSSDDMKSVEELEREGMAAYQRGLKLLEAARQKRGYQNQCMQGISGFSRDLSGMGMNRYPNQG